MNEIQEAAERLSKVYAYRIENPGSTGAGFYINTDAFLDRDRDLICQAYLADQAARAAADAEGAMWIDAEFLAECGAERNNGLWSLGDYRFFHMPHSGNVSVMLRFGDSLTFITRVHNRSQLRNFLVSVGITPPLKEQS